MTTIKFLCINKDDKTYEKKIIKYCSKSHQVTWFLLMVTLHGITQEKCGYIIFKDNRKYPVTFYTNNLACTPTKRYEGPSDHTIKCVHGLLVLKRWTSHSITMYQRFLVPSFIVAYNHLMNGVDTFDQVRGTNSCLRKENRVSTSIFDFVLDSSIQN